MKCPSLKGRTLRTCEAMRMPYVPSLFELEEYCMTEKHQRCPLFLLDERAAIHGAIEGTAGEIYA